MHFSNFTSPLLNGHYLKLYYKYNKVLKTKVISTQNLSHRNDDILLLPIFLRYLHQLCLIGENIMEKCPTVQPCGQWGHVGGLESARGSVTPLTSADAADQHLVH